MHDVSPRPRSAGFQETVESKVPALGYGMRYAIGNTPLMIFGTVIVLMMAPSNLAARGRETTMASCRTNDGLGE